jgi:signal transduction histidine kinase
VSATPIPGAVVRSRRAPSFIGLVAWLDRHRKAVLALAGGAMAGALLLDVLIPSYPIAGFYLVPITLAALILRVRLTLAVSLVCLVLALYVVVLQHRVNGPTITVVCFSVLSGVALIAMAYFLKRVGQLYEAERVTTERLESLATQLQTLQEVVVLDFDRSLPDLLAAVIEQAGQLLGSDGACVYRLDAASGALSVAASAGAAPRMGDVPVASREQELVVRALAERAPIALPAERRVDGNGSRDAESASTLLAVPLLVRQEPYGVLALIYREPQPFTDLDVRLAASFGGQVALAIENARLRAEVERSAAAAERSRLARDLHDSVTQSLFAASLKAEAVRRRWRPDSAEARRNVEDVERLTRGALAEMRTLLLEMRPHALTESSLGPLLEQLVAATEGRTFIDVEVSVGAGVKLPPDVTLALYRIAQESLHNTEHHSEAHGAWVVLDATAGGARLVVGDDGCGFDAGAVPPERLGLRMMRERADAAGLLLDVWSVPDKGTTVTAVWPGDDED